MASLTLVDLAKRTGNDAQVGIVESLTQQNAVLSALPFRGINGISFKYAQRAALPTVGFRGFNQGTAASKSVIRQVVAETKIIEGRSEVDKLLAEAHPLGVNACRAEEDAAFVPALGNTFNSAVFYGNQATDGTKFDGLATLLNTLGGTCVSATGSGTNDLTSMYFLSFKGAPGRRGVEGLLANGKNIDAVDMGLQLIADAGGTNKYPGYVTNFSWQPGLAVYDTLSIGRLANIKSNAKPTIALINSVITAMFPFSPDLIVCSKTVFGYIQELKGTTISDVTIGTNLFTRVGSFDGIPIVIDENITQTEAQVS